MPKVTRWSSICRAVSAVFMTPVIAVVRDDPFDRAARILEQAVSSRQVRAASIFVQSGETRMARSFGTATSPDAVFLLGSISKPIVVTALMTLYDKGMFDLDDRVQTHIPEFKGGTRSQVTVRHLLTHVSGLPDQLPQNARLRSNHATLAKFVKGAVAVPLHFEPGTQYEYSSMGILLAAEMAQRLSGIPRTWL